MKFTLWEKSIFFQMLEAIPRATIGEGRVIMKGMDAFEPTKAEEKVLQDNRRIDLALGQGRDLAVVDEKDPLPSIEEVEKALDKTQLIKLEKKYIKQAFEIMQRPDVQLMLPFGKRYRRRSLALEDKLMALLDDDTKAA